MKVQGNNLILFYRPQGAEKYKTLAYARSCDLELKAETRQKGFGNVSRWLKWKKGRKSWTISTGHLFAGKAQLLELMRLVKSDSEIFVMLATIEEEHGFDPATVEADGRKAWKGKALLTRLVLSASKGAKATIKIDLIGNGKLEAVNAPWILATGIWNDRGVWIDAEQWIDGE